MVHVELNSPFSTSSLQQNPANIPSRANESSDFTGIVSPNPIRKFIELHLKTGLSFYSHHYPVPGSHRSDGTATSSNFQPKFIAN